MLCNVVRLGKVRGFTNDVGMGWANECFSSRAGGEGRWSGFNALPSRIQGPLLRVENS